VAGSTDLTSLFDEGRRAWPAIVLDPAAFDRFVLEHAPDADFSNLRAVDLYLACACAESDPRALAEFDATFLRHTAVVLARWHPTERFVDDVRQQVRERLFVEGKIRQYAGHGSLAAWVRVVTARVAANMRRQEKPHADVDDMAIGTAIDPELGIIQERYGDAFSAALRDAIASLAPDDRNLVRLHYLDGLNIERIGALFHVARATIGRRVIAVRERILEETHRLLRERLNATPSEIESLLQLVRSRLDVSLSDALREGDEPTSSSRSSR
jgi:RNA polymerase sigma-70 factor (ECF subfamily)